MNRGWNRLLFYLGIVLLIAGAVDPLEGSVIIASGSALLTLAIFQLRHRHRKKFLLSLVMILTGMLFMWLFSCLGGFGDNSGLAWGWAVLILPFPAGWLITCVLLLTDLRPKPKADSPYPVDKA